MSTTSLRALADHLQRERHRLLQTWRELLVRDPELTTYAGLPHATLEDHFPALIEDFTRRLRLENEVEATVFDIEHRKRAAEHATQRWEVGYDLREALREWGHFQAAVLLEIERYAASCQLLHVELDIQSAPGQGATIRMTLPLHYSAGPDRTVSAEGTPRPPPRKQDGVN